MSGYIEKAILIFLAADITLTILNMIITIKLIKKTK